MAVDDDSLSEFSAWSWMCYLPSRLETGFGTKVLAQDFIGMFNSIILLLFEC